ncbi:MAG: hypothetical protein AB7U82_34805 [Blastocatellales bacterium]
MIISFALTEKEFLAGVKTCTRRRWKPATAARFKRGTIHYAWSNLPFVDGAHQIGKIRATADAYQERLGDMPAADLLAEGGMVGTVAEFIKLIEGSPDELIWVARFEILEYHTPASQRT